MVLTATECRRLQNQISEVERQICADLIQGTERIIRQEINNSTVKTSVEITVPSFIHGQPEFSRQLVLKALHKEFGNLGFNVTEKANYTLIVSWSQCLDDKPAAVQEQQKQHHPQSENKTIVLK